MPFPLLISLNEPRSKPLNQLEASDLKVKELQELGELWDAEVRMAEPTAQGMAGSLEGSR